MRKLSPNGPGFYLTLDIRVRQDTNTAHHIGADGTDGHAVFRPFERSSMWSITGLFISRHLSLQCLSDQLSDDAGPSNRALLASLHGNRFPSQRGAVNRPKYPLDSYSLTNYITLRSGSHDG